MKMMAQRLELRKYAPLFFFLVLFGSFFSLSTIASGENLFGKDGWVLFHTDKEGTRYYYDEKSVATIGDARSAKYISVYSAPKSYMYGYVVDAQVECGLLFYKIRIMSLQGFGKSGPDYLSHYFHSAPPDDEFRRARAGSPVYYFAQAMCKLNR